MTDHHDPLPSPPQPHLLLSAPMVAPGPRRRWLRWVLLLALIGAGGWWWHSHQASTDAGGDKTASGGAGGKKGGAPTPIVGVGSVGRADVPIYLDALGTIQAYNLVTVHAQVDGQLLRVNFNEGQEIAAGAVLAEIDPRLFQAAYDQAVANTARDAATLANAKLDLTRYASLGNAIAQQTVDTQRATVRQAEATVAADRAAAASAKTQLGYTRIVAPISGRTGIRQVDVGNIVHPGDTNGIVTIAQLQPISVLFSLPQQDLPKIVAATARGTVAVLATDADGKVLDTGTLALVDNTIDQATGTVRLKATLPNDNQSLWPGAFTNVRLLADVLQNALYVAAAAVQRGPDGTFVYVFDPATHKVALRNVTVALTEDQVAVISQGLNDGDQVVTDNSGKLNDGMTVALPGETPARGDANTDKAKQAEGTAGHFGARKGAHSTEGAAGGQDNKMGVPNSGPGEGSTVKGAEGGSTGQAGQPQGTKDTARAGQ